MTLSIWMIGGPWIHLAALLGLAGAAVGVVLLRRCTRKGPYVACLLAGLLPLVLAVVGYERGRPRLEEFLREKGVAEAQAGPVRAQFLHDAATAGMLMGVPAVLLAMIGIVFRAARPGAPVTDL